MIRNLVVSFAVAVAVAACSGLVQTAQAAQPAARISPYSPEGQAITAQIKKLDRSIRFQQKMSSERAARTTGADSDRYVIPYSYYGYGGYGGYGGSGGYGGYDGGGRVVYFPSYSSSSYSPGLGVYFYNPSTSTAPGPNRGTAKYRRLVGERAALQAQLAPF